MIRAAILAAAVCAAPAAAQDAPVPAPCFPRAAGLAALAASGFGLVGQGAAPTGEIVSIWARPGGDFMAVIVGADRVCVTAVGTGWHAYAGDA